MLYDVAIIDENNIWAVGEIFMNDSLGNPDPIAFNAAYWNGSEWDIKKINVLFRGSTITPRLEGVFAFSANDIWFVGSLPIHGNGTNWTMYDLRTTVDPNLSLSKAWGSSSNDIYFVGRNGSIAHKSGNQWTKIESGTTLHLTDIYGDDKGNIYAAGVNISNAKGVVVKNNYTSNWIIMIEGDIIDESQLFDKLFGRLGSLWTDEIGTLYVGADFLYQFKNKKWNFAQSLPENFIGGDQNYIGYLYSMGGNRSNDLIIAGDRNTLRHFNGIDWSEIGIPCLPTRHIFWRSVQMKGNLAVVVGDEGIKAKIIMLKR